MSRLGELRRERGFTQRDLARKAGVSLTIVASVEEGSLRASAALIVRLAKALGVTPEELLREAPSPGQAERP
jgi:transcriptional regulator with XRE-family HTH domain